MTNPADFKIREGPEPVEERLQRIRESIKVNLAQTAGLQLKLKLLRQEEERLGAKIEEVKLTK